MQFRKSKNAEYFEFKVVGKQTDNRKTVWQNPWNHPGIVKAKVTSPLLQPVFKKIRTFLNDQILILRP